MASTLSISQPRILGEHLKPKYWLAWLGLGVLRLLHNLPFRLQLRLGGILGSLLLRFNKRRAHIAKTNIAICFPFMQRVDQQKLLRQHFRAIGMGLFETTMALWGTDNRIADLVEITGIEYLQDAKQSGRGVVLITGHFTTLELAGQMLCTQMQVGALYRPLKNRVMDRLFKTSREKRVYPLVKRQNTYEMIRLLKQGEVLSYSFDQDYGSKQSMFIPFFCGTAATITSTSRVASMSNALVIPYFTKRLSNGRYQLEISPPLKDFPSHSLHQDTARLNDLLEDKIEQAPEQYFWMHRRFKTRPEGEMGVY